MSTIKKYAIWIAIIWAANYAGSHGYKVGTVLAHVGAGIAAIAGGAAIAANGK